MFGLFAVAPLVLTVACQPAPSAPERPAGADPGALVIIGGRLEPDNEALFAAMLALRDGPGPVCVLPTASADPEGSIQAYIEDFARYGGSGTARGVAIASGDFTMVEDPQVSAALRECSGFFFTGGDQSRIVDTFRPGRAPSPAYQAVAERWREGAFIAGTSAGAAMMSDPMIGGGDSATALDYGVCDADGCPGVWVRDGMGFWPGWITDQHFLIRGRAGRLLAVLLELPEGPRRGLGVDEDTGVIVRGDAAEVVGRSGALVIDASAAERRGDGWANVRMHLYGPGDRFSLRDGALLEPGAPARTREGAGPTPTITDAFAGWGFAELLLAMGAQPDPAPATLASERWSVRVAPGPEFSAGAPVGPQGVGSVGPFVVDVSLHR